MRPKFQIVTFGCQMNKDDSERMAGVLAIAGYEPADSEHQADLIVFNTCSVRQNADERLYGQVGALKPLKTAKPGLIIAVGGCLGQSQGEQLQKRMPHVDIVFGTHNLRALPELLEGVKVEKKNACQVLQGTDDFAGDLPAVRQHAWHAWLPITVGCNNFCSYCVVPYVRGREKSRPINNLVEACKALVGDGVSEITLLGQNVNSYGRDLYGAPRFKDLMREISLLRGLERIRFTTSHPKDLTEDVIELVASRDNICAHFHLPLQAGSDTVLKSMRRQYTAEEYLRLVKKIRELVADVSITTDIMVGFPGESESDFKRTLEVVGEARFDQAYTFIYSPRPGTSALSFAGHVSDQEKSNRFARLIEVQNQICLENNLSLVGKVTPVFVEGLSKKPPNRLAARTMSNKLVHVDGPDDLIGECLQVQIDTAYSWFLVGEVVGGP